MGRNRTGRWEKLCGRCPKFDKGWCVVRAKCVRRDDPACQYGAGLRQKGGRGVKR